MDSETYWIRPIGVVQSPLTCREDAPRQGWKGAPAAWIELDPAYRAGLQGVEPGHELVIITWLHLSERDILQVHPRGDDDRPTRGVFSTRAPVRPNPLGLHPVTVLEVDGMRLKVEPIEAVDGTPVVDIKAAYSARG
ncbi:MAG: tRNA (N6-threonylcarbamoyladenosine(37)-N6)-methyltransferase TrmO [Longimicrobiales bacterium]